MATHAAFMPGAKVETQTFWGAVASWLTTVDHKRIGILYGSSAFIFFLIGGIEALIMRLQLARPDNTLVSAQTFNELF
ncbi:MAG: cytochrome ubiquinol oxidase subunit I, partial [Candidatus Rokuibacteriota bacterium]